MGPRKRRRHRPTLNPPKKEEECQVHFCAHCSSHCVYDPCDNDLAYCKLIREIPVVRSFKQINDDESQQQQSIKIYDVLASIYKLNYLHQLKLLDNNRGGEKLLLDEKRQANNVDDDQDTTDIGLCPSCAENLTYLYNCYHQFTLTAHLDSYLSKHIKKLNDIVHRLEISQKDTTSPPLEILETRDSAAAVVAVDKDLDDNNEQCQFNCGDDDYNNDYDPFDFDRPIKLESKDDHVVFYNEDYSDVTFVGDNIEAGENEGNMQKKLCAKKFNTTTTATTVKSISTPTSPFVKLCALTEAEIKAAATRKSVSSSKQGNKDLHNDQSHRRGHRVDTDPKDDDPEQEVTRKTRTRKSSRTTAKISPKYISSVWHDDSDASESLYNDVDYNGQDEEDNENDDDFGGVTPVPKKRRRGRSAESVKRQRVKMKGGSDGGDENDEDNNDSDLKMTGGKLGKERRKRSKNSGSPSCMFKLNCDNDVGANQVGSCVLCDKVLTSARDQVKHVLAHVPDFEENSVQTCPVPNCSNTYSTRPSLVHHLRTLHCPHRVKLYSQRTTRIRNVKPRHNDDDHGDADDDGDDEGGEVDSITNCIMCNETFDSLSALYKHVLIHIPDFTEEESTTHPCPAPNCLHNYGKRPAMILHVRGVHCPGSGRCFDCPVEDCQEVYVTKNRRAQHLIQVHQPSGLYYCCYCLKNFSTEALLQEHESNLCPLPPHSSSRKICPAPACQSRSFNMEQELENHLKSDHAEQKLIRCTFPNCVSSFALPKSLRLHIKVYHTKECRGASCSTLKCRHGCLRTFAYTETLKKHEETCTGKKLFKCEVCNVTFSQWHYRLHMRRHLEGERKVFTCQFEGCGKTFMSKSGFWGHKIAHQPNKHFVCENCGKVCTSAGNYKSHQLIHSEEKKHLCTVCGKTFLRSQGLKKHLRVHSDQKSFGCHICHKVFPYIESVNHHIHHDHLPMLPNVEKKPHLQQPQQQQTDFGNPSPSTDFENPPPIIDSKLFY